MPPTLVVSRKAKVRGDSLKSSMSRIRLTTAVEPSMRWYLYPTHEFDSMHMMHHAFKRGTIMLARSMDVSQ